MSIIKLSPSDPTKPMVLENCTFTFLGDEPCIQVMPASIEWREGQPPTIVVQNCRFIRSEEELSK